MSLIPTPFPLPPEEARSRSQKRRATVIPTVPGLGALGGDEHSKSMPLISRGKTKKEDTEKKPLTYLATNYRDAMKEVSYKVIICIL
jgi:hypothetical protein